jgi:ribosomal protein L37AE/L43A
MNNQLPQWAGRVPRWKISELYQKDADGIVDDELIEEVGISFMARCISIIEVSDAHRGRMKCPSCSNSIQREGLGTVECEQCGWSLPWATYHKTYKKKHLTGGGFLPFAEAFVDDYPKARTSRDKMILIDILMNRFHGELRGKPHRPGAIGLIGGRPREIKQFLDDLFEGRVVTDEQRIRGKEWVETVGKERKDMWERN